MSFTRYLKARTGRDGSHADECHEINGSAESNKFPGGEEVGDFEDGGLRGVGAVRAVHLNARAEVAADGAGSSFLGIRGAHGLAPFGDGAFGFENHGEDFAGAHEVGEFAEERALAMNGVETGGFLSRQPHGFDGHDFEPGFVNAGENLALEIAADRVRFDDGESALDCHEKKSSDMKKTAGKMPALQNPACKSLGPKHPSLA